MRILLICGSHPRHLYFADELLKTGCICGVVMQKREPMVWKEPYDLDESLRRLYNHHFRLRYDLEMSYFGHVESDKLLSSVPSIEVDPVLLNDISVEYFIKECRPDYILSYGPDLIKDNILQIVDGRALNLHGGLSPYYKGAATMFWPFYFLEPNYAGFTFHFIARKIDAGRIVHQSLPKLEKGDCMHEVACKTVISATEDIKHIVKMLDDGMELNGTEQKSNGKLFLRRDWRPEHLKVVYELYNDQIVDMFLNGEISKDNNPKVIKAF